MHKFENTQLDEFYRNSAMREGIICWYPFREGATVIDLTDGVLSNLLARKGLNAINDSGVADYIVAMDPEDITAELLKTFKKSLSKNGRLLLAFENPFGLKFWCGKRNRKTDYPFDFCNVVGKSVVSSMLKSAGFHAQKWYYPMSDHWFATEIYSQNFLPSETLMNRWYFYVEDDYSLVANEFEYYSDIIRHGAFELMNNAYLVETCVNPIDRSCDVDYIAVTAYREKSKRYATLANGNGTAAKIALDDEGVAGLHALVEHHRELASVGVNVLPVELIGNRLTMCRVEWPLLWDYWCEKIKNKTFDANEMYSQFDRIRDAIYLAAKSGRCYWELVPANCFYNSKTDELLFFDQEFAKECLEPEFAVARAINAIKWSPVMSADKRSDDWLDHLKNRYSLSDKWNDYSSDLLFDSRSYVFNDKDNQVFLRAAECAAKRAAERDNERKIGIAQKRADIFDADRNRLKKIKDFVDRLLELPYSMPIIYGNGTRGKMLKYALEIAGYDVPCVVDREKSNIKKIDDIPNDISYDVIIVSILKGDSIAKELRETTQVPVITIEEILNVQN